MHIFDINAYDFSGYIAEDSKIDINEECIARFSMSSMLGDHATIHSDLHQRTMSSLLRSRDSLGSVLYDHGIHAVPSPQRTTAVSEMISNTL